MTWVVMALAGGLGALVVGIIGFGTSLVVLPTLAILFPSLFALEVALRLATGTTMAVGADVSWPLLRLAILPYAADALLGPWAAHTLELRAVLFGIGFASSVAGIASGLFAIPYLCRFTIPLRTVIGTSTVGAALYSASGALGHVSAGWGAAELPAWSLGFVYLPALGVMAIASVACGPIGVRLSGRIDEAWLRGALGVIILAAALVIAWRST